MARFFHLFTTLPNGVTLHVKHAPVANVAGVELDDAAAAHGVAPRKPDESDDGLRARIHASAPVETVEVKPGMPNKVSSAFWLRWLHLNPSMPLMVDGKIQATEVDEPDPDAAALAERRADATAATGPALDHLAALHGVAGRGPGEADAAVRARLLAAHAGVPAASQPEPVLATETHDLASARDPAIPVSGIDATNREDIAAASGAMLDGMAGTRGIPPRSDGESDDALRARLLVDMPTPEGLEPHTPTADHAAAMRNLGTTEV